MAGLKLADQQCRITGSGKPLRFKHWGAHEDLSPPSSRPHHDLKAQLAEPEEQGIQEFILVRATDVV